MYLLYKVYADNFNSQVSDLVLDMTLITSFYFVIRFNEVGNHFLVLLLFNIPFLIAILKQRKLVSILLSVAIVVYYNNAFGNVFNILLVEYISYYVLYFMLMKRGFTVTFLLNSFILMKVFFLSIIYYSMGNYLHWESFLILWFCAAVFYFLSYYFFMIFEAGEQVTKLHTELRQLLRDKQLKASLFKISHEIKNPMAVCKGYISMMNLEDIKKSEKYIKVIDEEIDRALLILDDFLVFNKVNVKKQTMDLNHLMEDIVSKYELLLETKFLSEIKPGAVFIEGDYERLKQVLINLIKNGVEAIPEERKGKVTLKTSSSNEFYFIEVIDNGIGMDPHTLDNVYEPFFTTKLRGTGLGVALSKEILDLHDGTIKYETKEGVGTNVLVSIPIKKTSNKSLAS